MSNPQIQLTPNVPASGAVLTDQSYPISFFVTAQTLSLLPAPWVQILNYSDQTIQIILSTQTGSNVLTRQIQPGAALELDSQALWQSVQISIIPFPLTIGPQPLSTATLTGTIHLQYSNTPMTVRDMPVPVSYRLAEPQLLSYGFNFPTASALAKWSVMETPQLLASAVPRQGWILRGATLVTNAQWTTAPDASVVLFWREPTTAFTLGGAWPILDSVDRQSLVGVFRLNSFDGGGGVTPLDALIGESTPRQFFVPGGYALWFAVLNNNQVQGDLNTTPMCVLTIGYVNAE